MTTKKGAWDYSLLGAALMIVVIAILIGIFVFASGRIDVLKECGITAFFGATACPGLG